MALGQILRDARISRGYTESEVAERIKMNAQMIVDLECENYSRIAAPIYGKGYVRKYAEFLGIDYRPLVEEFKNTFGSGNLEKPQVPLESFDPESGMLTKIIPAQAARQTSDIQQPVATPVVQSIATPAQVVNQTPVFSSESEIVQPSKPEVVSETLFTEFESQADVPQVQQLPEEPKEEVFVSAHLATTPPTPTIPPPNTIPDSIIQSKYTSSPEKFTPRTTVFKPEQIPSASAPDPVALNVDPFSFPEAEVIVNNTEENSPIIVTDGPDDDEELILSSHPRTSQSPILSRYLGKNNKMSSYEDNTQKTDENKKSLKERFSFVFSALTKCSNFFKDLFNANSEDDDLTKTLARKQRILGFVLAVVVLVIVVIVSCVGGSNENEQDVASQTTEEVNATESNEEIPELVSDSESNLEVSIESIEVVQILPTPKGFVD
ncbi:MAG: helix-turn-helix domain-containing protein [Kiritimatiellae bacterium]|nr:helix-turn-helix domain-containing protein [Kiritimatiellia bacterium]